MDPCSDLTMLLEKNFEGRLLPDIPHIGDINVFEALTPNKYNIEDCFHDMYEDSVILNNNTSEIDSLNHGIAPFMPSSIMSSGHLGVSSPSLGAYGYYTLPNSILSDGHLGVPSPSLGAYGYYTMPPTRLSFHDIDLESLMLDYKIEQSNYIGKTISGVRCTAEVRHPTGTRFEKKPFKPRNSTRRPKGSHIRYEHMKRLFNMPISQAAIAMNIGLTGFKVRCRELGILKWPARKIKCLNSLMHNLQGLAVDDNIRVQLDELQKLKQQIEKDPNMDLPDNVKNLRQDCFKAKHMRRGRQHPY